MVTVRPAPHPHCSKSRFSSWDEVKMRCRFTTLVLIKKKADNFFLLFVLPLFGCSPRHAKQHISPSGFYSLPSNYKKKSSNVSWWWLRLVFSPARSYHVQYWATDRRPGCVADISCCVWRWEAFIDLLRQLLSTVPLSLCQQYHMDVTDSNPLSVTLFSFF